MIDHVTANGADFERAKRMHHLDGNNLEAVCHRSE
jgi:hypothetical protein